MIEPARVLHLCAGTQSSGSTLVSWCFLQRADMNGVLDGENDLLPVPPSVAGAFVWYKTTISCFRLSELIAHYQDEGWSVRPLLVVRDVRRVWASLSRKHYGRNGTTAEDPPLRLRLRRFKEDWELFRREHRPMVRYEDMMAEPEKTLRATCTQLQLPWDDAMLTWPKDPKLIASTRHGNETFHASLGQGLRQSIRTPGARGETIDIPPADLEWLESEFREFNAVNGYPSRLEVSRDGSNGRHRAVPNFQVTRRYKWEIRRKPFRWLLSSFGGTNPFPYAGGKQRRA
jgi:hypothetical protein